MYDYGMVTGARPKDFEVLETKVLVATNIKKVTEKIEGDNDNLWEYHLVEYTKDEYIRKQADEISEIEDALCELSMGVM